MDSCNEKVSTVKNPAGFAFTRVVGTRTVLPRSSVEEQRLESPDVTRPRRKLKRFYGKEAKQRSLSGVTWRV